MDPLLHLLSTPLLVLHILAALFSLSLAPINLVRRRRDRAHRMIGRSWVGAMVTTCLTSFAVQEPWWAFSWLHALSVWTLFSLWLGVQAIRRGNRPAHIGNMVGCYLGLWIAFLFAALVPDRTISQVTVAAPGTGLITVLLVLCATAATWWVFRPARPRIAPGDGALRLVPRPPSSGPSRR